MMRSSSLVWRQWYLRNWRKHLILNSSGLRTFEDDSLDTTDVCGCEVCCENQQFQAE